MRCPQCGTENPEGRGFCIHCAYPLPESPRPQPPVMPWQEPTPPVPQKKVLVRGIIGFILAISGTSSALNALSLCLNLDALRQFIGAYFSASYPFNLSRLTVLFAAIGALIVGGVGMGLSCSALSKASAHPQSYSAGGLYRAGVIVSSIGTVLSVVLIVVMALA